MLHVLRAFYRQNATVIATSFFAFSLVTLGFVVDRFDVLPLQGQSTPVYSPLPSGRKVSIVRSSRSRSSRVPARLKNRSSAPAALYSGPSSASSQRVSSASWTGNECPGYGTPSEVCHKKMVQMAAGDYACIADRNCWAHYRFGCYLPMNDCASMAKVQWLFESFMPECYTNQSAACDQARQYFTGTSLPKSVQTCLGSTLCREILSTFRTGDFACRQYEPCLNALQAMLSDPLCTAQNWCSRMAAISSAYDEGAAKCASGSATACQQGLGLEEWTVTNKRFAPCRYDSDCLDDLEKHSQGLHGFSRHNPVVPACFLWPECKQNFEADMRWACQVGGRDAQCAAQKRVYEYLTKTRPSCVTSGESKSCQDAIRQLW